MVVILSSIGIMKKKKRNSVSVLYNNEFYQLILTCITNWIDDYITSLSVPMSLIYVAWNQLRNEIDPTGPVLALIGAEEHIESHRNVASPGVLYKISQEPERTDSLNQVNYAGYYCWLYRVRLTRERAMIGLIIWKNLPYHTIDLIVLLSYNDI